MDSSIEFLFLESDFSLFEESPLLFIGRVLADHEACPLIKVFFADSTRYKRIMSKTKIQPKIIIRVKMTKFSIYITIGIYKVDLGKKIFS